MSVRPTRSASIPIPPSSSSAARSLEDVLSLPFARTPPSGTASRPRRTSGVSRSPEEQRLRGPSVSPVRSTISTSPSRSLVGSYSSAVGRSPAQRVSIPTNAGESAPTYQPRIIRAASNPTPSRDPVACLPGTVFPAPAPSTSPVRPYRLGDRSTTTPAAPRLSSSLSAGTRVNLSSTSAHAVQAPPGFPRPEYLEYSALRDFLHIDAPAIIPPARISHPLSAAAPPQQYPYLSRSMTPGDSDSERTPSPSPPPQDNSSNSSSLGMLSANPVLRLPTRWSEQDRGAVLSISQDGREVTFCGSSFTGEKDSAAARTNFPIPPACGIYYYEVEVMQRGQKGHISVGFSAGNVRLTRLPGWESQSWGYHADDGWCFAGTKEGTPYGPTFDSGDIIGCGIDFSQNRAFYTKNGAFLGMLFENIPTATVALYPSIGMRHNGESVRANFGQVPFRFAIADYVRTQRDVIWGEIMRIPGEVPHSGTAHEHDEEAKELKARMDSAAEEATRATLRKLVMGYLAHHGYARTAKAFGAQCTKDESMSVSTSETASTKELAESAMDTDDGPRAGPSTVIDHEYGTELGPDPQVHDPEGLDAETRDLQTRLSILHAVRAGDIDRALDELETHYPQALGAQDGLLLFHLRCRKFVELVLKAGAALRKVKEAEKQQTEKLSGGLPPPTPAAVGRIPDDPALDGEGAMDVDDPSPEALPLSTAHDLSDGSLLPAPAGLAVTPSPADAAKHALHTALAYGQRLEADYKSDTRPAVQTHRLRTFGLVAYEDPENEGGEVGALAGQEARVQLASEVNQAILQSQGRPVHPALETLVRQAGACVVQLGLLGVGRAAFADVRQELLEA
ncbi:SPRY-domain-containing protein [Daedalea quercina L-15889]|uniref:SPRY-domain-containing protein n=1 Tax=Daedalea quercina L-15889 TaxID=1314783 RepID=A0A165PXT9_9APHY|nr:SPRY-domain-containing protein [Daedalea quercina L-15889]